MGSNVSGRFMNVYEYVFTSLHGTSLPLSNYRGQPILVVNTASQCGYTPQYQQLQKIWDDYRQSNLVVLGIPSNDFVQFGGRQLWKLAHIKVHLLLAISQNFMVQFV